MATTRQNYASGTYGTDNSFNPDIQTLDRMVLAQPVLFPQFCDVRETGPTKALRYVSEDPLSYGTAASTLAYSGSNPSSDPAKQTAGLSPHTLNVTEQLFAKDVLLNYRDMQLDPTLKPRKMQAMVDMWGRHLDALAALALTGSFATNTVPDGNGSTCYFFAATGSGHILKSGSEQVNASVLALSGAAMTTAKAAIWGWLDNRGEPLNLTGVKLCLVTGPALGDLAFGLTGAGPTDITTIQVGGSSGAVTRVALNPHSGIAVVVNPYITSATQWFMVPVGMYSPIKAWIERPVFNINVSDGRNELLQMTYQAKIFPTPPTYTTAFGSTGAGA